MQICKLGEKDLREALELVWEVFSVFEAPDYEQMGIKTFRHFIDYASMRERIEKKEMIFWGCYLNNYLIGIIALRTGQHISLLFVRDRFHHLGVASRLVRVAIAHVASEKPDIPAITVNSSPYAVGFYEAVGFKAMGPEQRRDGIRYTSMRRGLTDI